jgi:hypothetical protein
MIEACPRCESNNLGSEDPGEARVRVQKPDRAHTGSGRPMGEGG